MGLHTPKDGKRGRTKKDKHIETETIQEKNRGNADSE